MNSSNERIYRAVYSAIVGSKLTARDLRRFVEMLSADSEFVYLLQKGIWEFADSIDHSFAKQSQLEFDSLAGGSKALSEIVIDRIQAERVSKLNLMRLLSSTSKRASKGLDPGRHTVRQLVEGFFDKATASEISSLLHALGVEVTQDPYLGGIDRKTGADND